MRAIPSRPSWRPCPVRGLPVWRRMTQDDPESGKSFRAHRRSVVFVRRGVMVTGLVAALAAAVAVGSPAHAGQGGSGGSTGTARVFMVNPVQSSGNENLTDQND